MDHSNSLVGELDWLCCVELDSAAASACLCQMSVAINNSIVWPNKTKLTLIDNE